MYVMQRSVSGLKQTINKAAFWNEQGITKYGDG
jgi:hypothetical protein